MRNRLCWTTVTINASVLAINSAAICVALVIYIKANIISIIDNKVFNMLTLTAPILLLELMETKRKKDEHKMQLSAD